LWAELEARGLRPTVLRLATHVGWLVIVGLGIWAVRSGLDQLPVTTAAETAETLETLPAAPVTAEPTPEVMDLPPFGGGGLPFAGISRLADVHTVRPNRPRLDITKYVVQEGDTIFGIAEKFALKPETVLWGNWYTLAGDPHTLRPGQELNILPVDGALHVWSEGEGLNGVAEFFGVTAQNIIDWPGNHLDPNTDPANPEIEPGTALVIPGGRRDPPSWQMVSIRRSDPAVAKILWPGYCGSVYDGPIGTGVFDWPTSTRWRSGYPFVPGIHEAVDLGGSEGNPVYASDSGVVVYSGWNDWGYGLVVVIDHGNGWQTLYAHMSQINVVCGQAAFQGNVIGLVGCTGNCSGPHLHFEMRSDLYGRVNPYNFLP
jgi:murein DD-endopeptidase MepM/ murein hydrolase activator NlpD